MNKFGAAGAETLPLPEFGDVAILGHPSPCCRPKSEKIVVEKEKRRKKGRKGKKEKKSSKIKNQKSKIEETLSDLSSKDL